MKRTVTEQRRPACYARLSSDKARLGSVAEQERSCREFAKSMGWLVAEPSTGSRKSGPKRVQEAVMKQNAKETVRAAIYLRAACDEARANSLVEQERSCRERAASMKWQVVEVFSDTARSGTKCHDRQGFASLLERAGLQPPLRVQGRSGI